MSTLPTPPTTKTLLEHYREAIRTGSHPFPYAETIGFALKEVEPGRAVIELDADARHTNTIGSIHGGVYCSVADTATGIAHGSLLAEGEISTTVDLKVNFLRPLTAGKVRAVARVVKHGRSLTFVDCDVTGSDGKLLVKVSSICMTLRPGQTGTVACKNPGGFIREE